MEANTQFDLASIQEALGGKRHREWVNLGGQIMLKKDLDQVRADICSGKLESWREIHKRYDRLWHKYPLDKQKHAFAVLCMLYETDKISPDNWHDALDKAAVIQDYISDQVYGSRRKDYDNPFRFITFRNSEEMRAAIGTVDENSFIIQVRQETVEFNTRIKEIKQRNR